MTLLTLLDENDPFLRTPIEPLDPETAELEAIRTLAMRMHETRIANKAIGLAANQVGLNVRMFVIGLDFAEFSCVNPEIISVNEELVSCAEGCLSFPGLVLKVKRPSEIRVRYLDLDLKPVETTMKGMMGRCFQHELDHLNGIVFTGKVSKLVLEMAKKKQAKKTN
jgi:peptide deformylase